MTGVVAHREAVVDVLGAGLGHTGVRQVHFIKNQRLRPRKTNISSSFVAPYPCIVYTITPFSYHLDQKHSILCHSCGRNVFISEMIWVSCSCRMFQTSLYLAVFGIVEGPPSEFEVPPLPSLEGAGLL